MSLRDLKRTLLACPSLKSSSSSSSTSIGLRKPPKKSSLRDQIASIERLAADFQCTPSGETLPPQRSRSPSPPASPPPSSPAPPSCRKQHDLDRSALPNPVHKRIRLSDYASFFTDGRDPQDLTNATQRLESDVDNALLPNPAPKRTRLSDYASFLIDGRDPQVLANTTHQHFESDELLRENQDRVDEENEVLVGLPHAQVDSEAGLFIQSQAEGVQEPLVLWPPDGQGTDVVQVLASINSRLLEHQRVGVQFLYSLYRDNKGGVLGDDMGLGKTIQVIAFLSAIFQHSSSVMDQIRHHKLTSNQKPVLIICPTSVLRNWEQEFHAWGNFDVALYHGAQREHVLSRLESRNLEIVLTSFDTFRIHGECLCIVDWDCVIVDEAHRLKNDRSDLYKVCVKIRTKRRYGLTGTIMQNKIMDLFNVFDWVAPGCLGTREHFREFYEEPLKQGQRINAPEKFIRVAEQRRLHLVRLLQKYLLRREKHDTIGHLMMGKEDNVVFCEMSPLQRRAYKRLLASPDFQCLIRKDEPCTCGSPLTRAECCYRIIPNGIIWPYLHRESSDGCDSCPYCLILPCLTKLQQVSNHLELIKPNVKDEHEKQRKDELLAEFILAEDAALVGGTAQDESFLGLSDAQHCGKMKALEQLLGHWLPQGDKVLLFSYSVRMLDILDKFLIRKGYCFSRLDGSTPMSARQAMVDDFNRSRSKQVFLISTRAGGLGLNLVSANRVVIFDPNWNPAQDLQAQDRSFRYGQRRHVTVYRLLAAGSLEELVYTRQIYKQQLFNIAVSGNLEKRYFEGVQDSKENKGELFGISNLFRDLSEKAFTSEIIESYNMRVQEDKQRVSGKGYCVVTGGELFKSTEEGSDSAKTAITEARSVKQTSDEELARVLKNAGVIYAHRNEDVVNLKSNSEKSENMNKKGKSASAINPLQPRNSLQMALVDKKLDIRKKSEKCVRPVVKKFGLLEAKKHTRAKIVTTKEEQFGEFVEATKRTDVKTATTKQEQFALLAASKGMSKTDFCQWLLSASEDERKCLLLSLNQGKS